MLDAKDSKSFQFRTFAIGSVLYPKPGPKFAAFILSTSENNVVLSGEIYPNRLYNEEFEKVFG